MAYYTVSGNQMFFNSIMIAILTAVLVEGINITKEYYYLPKVVVGKDNACVKVINYENGHAFNCQDVDVILRKYNKVIEE